MFTEDAVAIVDADSIYFRVACVTKNKKEIRQSINYTMDGIRRDCMTDRLLVAIKGKGNFRHDIYSKYKANRKELDPDLKKALNYGHEYMIDHYEGIMANGMEADDLVSIWAYEAMDYEQDYVIVGIDKDLRQIPGAHYNFARKTHDTINANEANLNLMLQCLTGDNSDNIPGIKGIGPVKAKRILSGVAIERRWNRVRAAWRLHNAGNPDVSRDLLTMLTSWRGYENIRNKIESKTPVREQNVLEERSRNNQDSGVSSVSE